MKKNSMRNKEKVKQELRIIGFDAANGLIREVTRFLKKTRKKQLNITVRELLIGIASRLIGKDCEDPIKMISVSKDLITLVRLWQMGLIFTLKKRSILKMKDNKIVVAFDVGGTLVKYDGISDLMIRLVKALASDPGFHIIIWTAGDISAAEEIKNIMCEDSPTNINLNHIQVMEKTNEIDPDIVFDDNEAGLMGIVNCLVRHGIPRGGK